MTAHAAVTVVVYLSAAAIAFGLARAAWQRRSAPGADALSVTMTTVGVWCLADLVARLGVGGHLPAAAAAAGLTAVLPSVAVIVAGFWVMSHAATDRDWHAGRRVLGLLAVHPVLVLAVAVTNPWTSALYTLRDRGGSAGPQWVPGPVFWVHTVACYSLLAWSVLRLVGGIRHGSQLQRRQAVSMLLACLPPAACSLLVDLYPNGSDLKELTALAYVLTGLIAFHALVRLELMRLVPVARRRVLDRLRDALGVLDPHERLLDVNRSGERLLRQLIPGLPDDVTGVAVTDLLENVHGSISLEDGQWIIGPPEQRLVLDLRVEALADHQGRPVGKVMVARDITELDTLRRHLAEQAVRDELTGLHNRRYLLDTLDRELDAARSTGRDLAVVMIDIDHFKSVNDEFGHSVGDALLVATGRALAGVMRDGDTIARYGGEEFVALLPGAGPEVAAARAEELRVSCGRQAVRTPAGLLRRTVSVGIASLGTLGWADGHAGGCDADDLLCAADAALYTAKAAGRNAVSAIGPTLGLRPRS